MQGLLTTMGDDRKDTLFSDWTHGTVPIIMYSNRVPDTYDDLNDSLVHISWYAYCENPYCCLAQILITSQNRSTAPWCKDITTWRKCKLSNICEDKMSATLTASWPQKRIISDVKAHIRSFTTSNGWLSERTLASKQHLQLIFLSIPWWGSPHFQSPRSGWGEKKIKKEKKEVPK
jgi:hypothetical protein